MGYSKTTAIELGLLWAGAGNGAVITGGTITFGQNSLRGSSGSSTDFQLDTGTEVAVFRSGDGDIAPTCDAPGAACSLTGLKLLVFGTFSSFNASTTGSLQFSYIGNYSLVHGPLTQTYSVPFTATGSLYFANPQSSTATCPFTGLPGNPCSVLISGSGIATSTVTQYFTTDEYYISQTVYSFTQAPEISTWFLVASSLCGAYLIRRNRWIRFLNGFASGSRTR